MYRRVILCLVCLLAALMVYPCYVLAAGLVDYWLGDGRLWLQWQYSPKRVVLEQFLGAWRQALPYSAVFGGVLLLLFALSRSLFRQLWLPTLLMGLAIMVGLAYWLMGPHWPLLLSLAGGFALLLSACTWAYHLLTWRRA